MNDLKLGMMATHLGSHPRKSSRISLTFPTAVETLVGKSSGHLQRRRLVSLDDPPIGAARVSNLQQNQIENRLLAHRIQHRMLPRPNPSTESRFTQERILEGFDTLAGYRGTVGQVACLGWFLVVPENEVADDRAEA